MSEEIVLDSRSESIRHLCRCDESLAWLIPQIGSLVYTPYDNPYGFLVSTIIGQMLSNKAASAIENKVLALCQGAFTVESISSISNDVLKSSGLSMAKVKYIRALTDSVVNGRLDLDTLQNQTNDAVIHNLTLIHGIGNWTAKMFLIFVLNRDDVLPYEDGAFVQSFKWLYGFDSITNEDVCSRCERWHPYSSIAARYLYRALDLGLTRERRL